MQLPIKPTDINPETGREYYWDCSACNYDRHECPGCGTWIGHNGHCGCLDDWEQA